MVYYEAYEADWGADSAGVWIVVCVFFFNILSK